MTGLERRWSTAILRAFTPSEGATDPSHGEVDYLQTLRRMRQQATPRAALGLRLAVWLVALAPLWLWGKLATVSGLPDHRRSDLLGQLLAHKSYLVRESCTLLKLTAAFALMRSRTFRARTGYDAAVAREREASGTRRRLPLAPTGTQRSDPQAQGAA